MIKYLISESPIFKEKQITFETEVCNGQKYIIGQYGSQWCYEEDTEPYDFTLYVDDFIEWLRKIVDEDIEFWHLSLDIRKQKKWTNKKIETIIKDIENNHKYEDIFYERLCNEAQKDYDNRGKWK